MKKQGKIATLVISVVAALGITAWALTGAGAANSEEFRLSDDLAAGTSVATADPGTGEKVKTDKFDNVRKKPGEKAGLVDEETNKSYFTIEVTGSTLAASCAPRVGNTPLKPTRTSFLVLDVKATLAADVGRKVAGGGELFMPLVAEAFSVTTASGTPDRNVTSESAWGCLDEKVLLPAVVNPGQSVRGKVVLDVATRQGQVAYDPDDNGGWSWPFGG